MQKQEAEDKAAWKKIMETEVIKNASDRSPPSTRTYKHSNISILFKTNLKCTFYLSLYPSLSLVSLSLPILFLVLSLFLCFHKHHETNNISSLFSPVVGDSAQATTSGTQKWQRRERCRSFFSEYICSPNNICSYLQLQTKTRYKAECKTYCKGAHPGACALFIW